MIELQILNILEIRISQVLFILDLLICEAFVLIKVFVALCYQATEHIITKWHFENNRRGQWNSKMRCKTIKKLCKSPDNAVKREWYKQSDIMDGEAIDSSEKDRLILAHLFRNEHIETARSVQEEVDHLLFHSQLGWRIALDCVVIILHN